MIKNMKNTYTNPIKKSISELGLIGNNVVDDENVKHLFLNDWIISNKRESRLYPNGLPWTGNYTKTEFLLDQSNSYIINNLGFRGKNFNENNELVFAGCSFTFGLGLPEKEIWGSQVAKALNVNYSNISQPGDSVVAIINNIYKYFEEYGHPKILLCLFPDFYRFIVPVNTETLITKYTYFPVHPESMLSSTHIMYQESETYSKKPHYAENVFSPDLPFFYSYQYIKMLEQYCKQAKILFLWSTWSSHLYNFIIQQENISNNFVDLKSNRWIKNNDGLDEYLDECNKHDHLRHLYPKNFDTATDIEDEEYYSKKARHCGVHKHMHWAEGFLEIIQDIKN
jgi:hypothetical protein